MDEPLSNPDTKLREDARNCIREVLRQSPDSRSYRVQGGPPLATAPYPVNPPYPPLRSNQPAASAASRCRQTANSHEQDHPMSSAAQRRAVHEITQQFHETSYINPLVFFPHRLRCTSALGLRLARRT